MSNRVAAVRMGEMMTLDDIPDHISIVSVTISNLNMPRLKTGARLLFRVIFWYILIWMLFILFYIYYYLFLSAPSMRTFLIISLSLWLHVICIPILSVRNPCFPPWPWICLQHAQPEIPELSQRRTLETGRHQSPAPTPCVQVHSSYLSTTRDSPIMSRVFQKNMKCQHFSLFWVDPHLETQTDPIIIFIRCYNFVFEFLVPFFSVASWRHFLCALSKLSVKTSICWL